MARPPAPRVNIKLRGFSLFILDEKKVLQIIYIASDIEGRVYAIHI